MYKNIVWFMAGYFTCKHVVPVVRLTFIKIHQKQQEGKI